MDLDSRLAEELIRAAMIVVTTTAAALTIRTYWDTRRTPTLHHEHVIPRGGWWMPAGYVLMSIGAVATMLDNFLRRSDWSWLQTPFFGLGALCWLVGAMKRTRIPDLSPGVGTRRRAGRGRAA